MRSLAIDPGASTGWALYEGRSLTMCGVCEPTTAPTTWGRIDRVVAEMPQKYPHDNIDPNSLLALALRLGLVVGPLAIAGARVTYAKPREWKGQLTKPICHSRSWIALSETERGLVSRYGKGLRAKPLLDMLDAVALGQWALATVWSGTR